MLHKVFHTILSPRNIKLPAQQAAVLFSVIVLLVGITTSLFLASVIARQARSDYQASLEQKQNTIESQLTSAVSGYNQLLIAGATLWNLKGDVTKSEWSQFYDNMQVHQHLPNTLGVGYVSVVSTGGVGSFETTMQADGEPGFTVHPLTGDSIQTPVTYLEPQSTINKQTIGYNMYSEPIRRAAMIRATEGASMAVTQPVSLVQDSGANADPTRLGVIMYYPVYSAPTLPMTIEARHKSLRGLVYVVVRPADVLASYSELSSQAFHGVNVTLADTSANTKQLASVNDAGTVSAGSQTAKNDIVVGNRTWAVQVTGEPGVVNTTVVPLLIIVGGSLLGFALAVTMLRTMLGRIEHVQRTYESEVERTKDELLALASHQLRTPASGVKQYIGILTSGIVGGLTPAQQQIAEKAFNANERQIEIINELLYVSKIEAGKVTIRPVRSNVTPIVQRLVDSMHATARAKNITLVFKATQARYAYGDDQYYTMIIDNLISNAIKYSYPDTKVVIKVTKQPNAMLAISVTDRGVGISSGDIDQLFQKFRRINNPLSRSESGSGLGLFLAYQLARAHGGEITVDSKEGKGSTFTLLMPTRHLFEEAQVNIVDHSDSKLPH